MRDIRYPTFYTSYFTVCSFVIISPHLLPNWFQLYYAHGRFIWCICGSVTLRM